MRKETKIGILLFTVFNIINFIMKEVGLEINAVHFLLGGLAGLAFAEIAIGMLSETTYMKLKNWKKNVIPFRKPL